MKFKASVVVMSHLSDVQEDIKMGYAKNGINYLINFVKFIILRTDGDLTQKIDPDELWSEYTKEHSKNNIHS